MENIPRGPRARFFGIPLVPVTVWAAAGAVFVAIQASVYLRWILSDDFRPTPTGADPVPAGTLVWMRVFEAASTLMLVIAIVWFVRGIRSTGRINATRLMMIGWLGAMWLDPFLNFLVPMFTYNAALVNMGSWSEFIPFFFLPGGNRIAEPLLVNPANYFVTFTSTAVAAAWAMRRAERRWPRIHPVVRSLCAIPAIWVSIGILDIVATRVMHFDGWLISHQAISLWGGQFYQFPVLELVLFPLPFIVCGLVLYAQDEAGHTPIERGVDTLAVPGWAKTGLRILAFIALCSAVNWAYTTLTGVIALTADAWPADVPSWLSNELAPYLGR